MLTATANQDARSADQRFQRIVQHRLSRLTKESADDLCALAEELNKTDDEAERADIAKTMMEIVYPESLRVNVEEIHSDARERLNAYRKKVGQAVKARRIVKKMTQQELADAAGIPQSHVSRIENGQHAPTHITMGKLAKALKTKVQQLDPGFSDDD